MAVTVKVPTVLRKIMGGNDSIPMQSGTIDQLIDGIEAQYPGVKAKLCDTDGKLRRFINIFVNGEDIRFLAGAATVVEDGAEVSIVPSIAGG